MIFAMLKRSTSVSKYKTDSITPIVNNSDDIVMRAVVPQTGYFSAALQLLFDEGSLFSCGVLESSDVLDSIDSKENQIFSDYIEEMYDASILFQIPADVTTISDELYKSITKLENKLISKYESDGKKSRYKVRDINHTSLIYLHQKILNDITSNDMEYTYVLITYYLYDSPCIVKTEYNKPSIHLIYTLISIDTEDESIKIIEKKYNVELAHDSNMFENLIFDRLVDSTETRTSYNMIYSKHSSPILQYERISYDKSSKLTSSIILSSESKQYYIEEIYINDKVNYIYILKNYYSMNIENHNYCCSSNVCRINHSDIEKSLFDKSSEYVEIQYDALNDFVKQIDDAPTKFIYLIKLYKNNQILASLTANSSVNEIIGSDDDRPNEYMIFDENHYPITKKVPDDFIYSVDASYGFDIITTLEI